ncbi:MAG: PA14 domain-containing protein [Euryarchaeota archaeon]|nr:PA14 domain-containing protein [Euryarchaeota archaeon]
MKKNHDTMYDTGISEIVSIVLIIFLVIMLVGVMLYITGALDDHLTTTPYLATSADVVNTRPDLRTISLENRGGDIVSLYGSAAAGGTWSVRFRLQSENISTDVEVDPLLKTGKWRPGGTLNIYRDNQTYWVTDNISGRADQIEDFGGGKWVVSVIDTGTDVLLAQHTLILSGSSPPGPVYAHGIVATYYSDEGWSNAAGTRIEDRIRFSDGTGETDEVNWPSSILGKENRFSVKFEGLLYIETEADYTFYLGSDDGSWLSIDGAGIIDNGGLHSLRYVSKTVHLTAGYHPVVVRMYEHTGAARIYLEYESPSFPRRYVTELFHTPISVPHADFSAAPQHIMTGEQVWFTDKSDDATEWHWEFGDSSSSTDRNPSHTYNTAGSYTVSLTAKNSYGADTMTKTDYITVGGTLLPGINATYYSDEGWSNAVSTRTENRIRFSDSWGDTDEDDWPFSILEKKNQFSVKFEGLLNITTEDDYTFCLGSDDGSWLFIDGAEIIDNGGLHSLEYVSETVHLTAGYHPVVVRMFEHTGGAMIYLKYNSQGGPYVENLFVFE